MYLSDVFSNVAYKRLAMVEISGDASNQHELNGSAPLQEFFGTDGKVKTPIIWQYFADDKDTIRVEGQVTFYDAREKDAKRTEWRLYYTGEAVELFKLTYPGDLLLLARTHSGILYGLIVQQDSAWLRAIHDLFDLDDLEKSLFLNVASETLARNTLEYSRQLVLDELGIETALPSQPLDEDLVLAQFPDGFPTTAEMSAFARTLVEVESDNPDETLIRWLNREEELFRALEKILMQSTLDQGFDSVDSFVSFSLSVQNRRKSRMGWAFTNHLAALFDVNGLQYSREKVTEGRSKPDFLFPDIHSYLDPEFPASNLIMLAAKSSCKDRWRQILTEAERIPEKHLCTLQAGISIAQTNEMINQYVTLVIPKSLHNTYTQEQLDNIWTVQDFVDFVRQKQG